MPKPTSLLLSITKQLSSGFAAVPFVYKLLILNLSSVPSANPHFAVPLLSKRKRDQVLDPVLSIVTVL